jgi:2-iminobutanoate/2-iminopropanoate deaminase
MKQEVKTEKAQNAKGLLSQAIISNGFIFTSGFIHLTQDGELIVDSVEKMFGQVMKNIEVVLQAANSNLDNIIKVTLYVTDIAILSEVNRLYVTYFKEPLPAREAVCVKDLPLGAKIEMSVIAAISDPK